jgi:HEPN domain-containing protein
MSADKRIAAFLAIAEEELQAARMLAEPLPRQAAFFLQQAAEKVARAVLTREGINAGISHSLRYLGEAMPAGHALRLRIIALDRLSSAATRLRYPSEVGRVAPAPLAGALQVDIGEIAALIEDARRHLGLD